jgi:Sulfotransferase domain
MMSDSAAAETSKQFALDEDLAEQIRRHGWHPFILLRLADAFCPERFVVCDTQNDVAQFVANVAAMPWFAQSKLTRGIARALERDIAGAAQLLWSWVEEPTIAETAYTELPDHISLPTYYDYPAFEVGLAGAPGDDAARRALLAEMLLAYRRADGNDDLRFILIETLALALGRAYGSLGEHDLAQELVEDALMVRPGSSSLKVARDALRKKLADANASPSESDRGARSGSNRAIARAWTFIERAFERFVAAYQTHDDDAACELFVEALHAHAGIAYPYFATRAGFPLSQIIGTGGRGPELASLLDRLFDSHPSMHLLAEPTPEVVGRLVALRDANIRRRLPSIVLVTLPRSASISVSSIFNSGFNLPSFCYSLVGLEVVESWARDYASGGACHTAHLQPTPQNIARLKRCGIDKLIVHVRDPRQALLSLTHYVAAYPRGPEVPLDQRLEAAAGDYLASIRWIEGWLDAEDEIRILFSRFEDFVSDKAAFIRRYLDFYGAPIELFSMRDAVTMHPGVDYHLRLGRTDEWREVMSPEQAERLSSWLPQRLRQRFGWID